MHKRQMAGLTRAAAIQLSLSAAILLVAAIAPLIILTGTPPAEPEPFYTQLPGVEFAGLPPEKEAAMVKQLNRQRCPCDCTRTVASCRNNHGSCSFSLAAAREAGEAAKRH